MTRNSFARACLLPALCLLVACSSQPEHEEAEAAEDDIPELTLNLPTGDCACDNPQANFTFLEKGVNALEEGAFLESLQYFQRYQRIEKSEVADIEAGIAIAYLSILPDSPIYDRDAAREAYPPLRDRITGEMELHSDVRLMQTSLDAFIAMYAQIDQLKGTNSSLRVELEKREQAIKRLRDLTLGREPEAAGLLGN